MKKEKLCECQGFATYTFDNTNFLANICPNCTIEGSTVTASSEETSFVATSVNPPNCLIQPQSKILLTSGMSVFVEDSTIHQGIYNLALAQFQEGTVVESIVILFFVSIDPTSGEPVLFLTTFEPDELSITQCRDSSSTSSSNVLPPQYNHMLNLATNLKQNKLGKIIRIHSDGRIEEKDF
ncbi:hypothetical protein BTR23_04120 [Alkalihalophilus pseudofirmus]|nr:hypothetical protein BTR23_04120 [Alkalihalophilus pseudofirmus]